MHMSALQTLQPWPATTQLHRKTAASEAPVVITFQLFTSCFRQTTDIGFRVTSSVVVTFKGSPQLRPD